jgi:7-cyano-7-deazaguanine synthase
MDSVTMLYDYADSISVAVTFDYGSNHAKREIECACYHCKKLGIEHLLINLEFIHDYFESSLLNGSDAIPNGSYADENMKSTVVPFRNGIMLSIACGIAESRGLKNVLIANHSGDHAIYPDCRATFINSMSDAMAYGTYNRVRIFAPYTRISKGDIVKKGSVLNVDYKHTYSCYKGREKHCGVCGTCVERKEAFADAGIEDPTIYEL